MILAAALLVLLGLGLFVGGVLTDITVMYWLCVAACVAAGVFLVLARVRMGRAVPPARSDGGAPSAPATLQEAQATGASAAVTTRPDAGTTAPPAAPVGAPVGTPATELPAASEPVAAAPAAEPVPAYGSEPPSTAAHAHRGAPGPEDLAGDPPVEEVEVTDLLLVVDLRDEVLVVDEHPRYHLAGCRWLAGRETIPLPLDEARTDGFTPCGRCEPDRTLAERERGRRTGRRAP